VGKGLAPRAKVPVRRFPYGVVYRKTPSVIRILAVMHLMRKPGYWKERK